MCHGLQTGIFLHSLKVWLSWLPQILIKSIPICYDLTCLVWQRFASKRLVRVPQQSPKADALWRAGKIQEKLFWWTLKSSHWFFFPLFLLSECSSYTKVNSLPSTRCIISKKKHIIPISTAVNLKNGPLKVILWTLSSLCMYICINS